jgi:hypothetical protein
MYKKKSCTDNLHIDEHEFTVNGKHLLEGRYRGTDEKNNTTSFLYSMKFFSKERQ